VAATEIRDRDEKNPDFMGFLTQLVSIQPNHSCNCTPAVSAWIAAARILATTLPSSFPRNLLQTIGQNVARKPFKKPSPRNCH
jgi:hypothetical protein